jgi:uncharacterized membrane protein YkvA (DUF1232 family)
MTGSPWWDLVAGPVVALAAVWLLLILALLVVKPRGQLLSEALRLLPDTLRLIHRLATDTSQPRGVRIRLGLLLAYLAMPIDLIPDFIPVLGYADDAIIVSWTLRSIIRIAGIEPVRAHWPGTEEGFQALSRITGLGRPN